MQLNLIWRADSLIYITTGNGLSTYHYDTDSFTTYHLSDSLTKDDVVKNYGFFDIVEGEDGRYYIGSYSNGMLAFSPDTKQFKEFQVAGVMVISTKARLYCNRCWL